MSKPNEDSPNWRSDLARFLFCLVVASVVLALLGLYFHGKTGVEKVLTKLMMPTGFAWLLLCALVMQRALQKKAAPAIASGVVWCLFTAVASSPLADAGLRYLETIEKPFDPSTDQPLDVLIVLGGGTSDGAIRSQAAAAGDRVLYGAELFQQGFARRLVTTGESISGIGSNRLDPSEQTNEIWTKLGIPSNSIESLPGINTYGEMQAIKKLEGSLPKKRIGVLTSAWHLPRAMRLARAQGLELIPVAADYRSPQVSKRFQDYLPSSQNLRRLDIVLHELLAAIVSR